MKLIMESWRQFLSEAKEMGSFALYAPYDDEPYGTYASLGTLKEALEQIKLTSQDWEDWTIVTPEGNTLPAYEL